MQEGERVEGYKSVGEKSNEILLAMGTRHTVAIINAAMC